MEHSEKIGRGSRLPSHGASFHLKIWWSATLSPKLNLKILPSKEVFFKKL
jgi:hypothetical protein